MKQGKQALQSKTIRVGGLYIGGGLLVVLFQLLGQLQSILEAINLEELPPEMASGFMAIIGVIGGVQILLRMVTKEPILPITPPEDKNDAND